METVRIAFATAYSKAVKELEAAGGRVVHRFGKQSFVISMPAGVTLRTLKAWTAKPAKSRPDEERLLVRAWEKGQQRDDFAVAASMVRSSREGQVWGEDGLLAPGEDDPGSRSGGLSALSTGTPTSLFLTGSVAVGLIVVSGDSWHNVNGLLKHVSVAPDGTVWGVNSSDNIYRRTSSGWTRVSGKLKQISVGSSTKVWGVNSNDDIYRRSGNSWVQVPGKLKHVSVASDGTVWGVNSNDDIYRRSGNSWTKVSGKLKQISVGSSSQVWGVNSNDDIYYRSGSSWKKVDGKLKHVSVAKDGSVYGVNDADTIYRRVGTGWQSMPGKLKQISCASLNSLWGVNSADSIYHGSSSSGLQLSSAQKTKIVQEVQEGLHFMSTYNPSAKVSFHYDVRFVDVNATPGPDPTISSAYAMYEDGWRNAAIKKMGFSSDYGGVVDYVEGLRTALGTDWAYAAFFTQYPLNHFAYAGGVRLVMDYDNDGWGPDQINRVFAHETGHIFGASDEYGGCGCGASGHYAIPNNNCKNCTPAQAACLMNANTLNMCKWSGGQLGWSFWDDIDGKLKHVSVGQDDTVWGVNSNDDIYRMNGNSWTKVSGKLKQISVGSSGKVWGVNANDDIYYRSGSSWKNVGGKLKHVSVAKDGTVWGVNSNDDIYRRSGSSWTKVSGKLKQISVGSSSQVWGVNSNDDIYRRSGSSWTKVGGKLKYVSVAEDGTVWGVNSADDIYVRVNNSWTKIAGKLKQISTGKEGSVWGVNSGDNIYSRRSLATP